MAGFPAHNFCFDELWRLRLSSGVAGPSRAGDEERQLELGAATQITGAGSAR